MLNNLEAMKHNHDLITAVCKKYRKELTIVASEVSEYYGITDRKTYEEFFNSLSFDEFVGNYLVALFNPEISLYEELLNDEITFMEYVKIICSEAHNTELEELIISRIS